jgi:hypothetical protein
MTSQPSQGPLQVDLIADEVCLPSYEPLYPSKGVVLIDTSGLF